MSACSDKEQVGGPGVTHLVLVDRSGAKQDIPQPSTARAMLEAERAIRRLGRRLREVKVISQNTAIARWKADELHWQRIG
jgi:hypothetical protein